MLKLWVLSWKKRDRVRQRTLRPTGKVLPSAQWSPDTAPLDTNLDEARVHGGCGADHMDIGGGRGADALEGSISRGREGEVLSVTVLGAGAARGKAEESLSNEQKQPHHPCPVLNMCLAHRVNIPSLLLFICSRNIY